MAGYSLSPSGLRSRDTSPNPPFLVIKKLTPRRLPPIVFEGPKSDENQPPAPPPPPTPVPWSWYHRNCSPRPKPRSRLHRQQQSTNKSLKSSRTSNELASLCQFLNGRTYLLLEYILSFFSFSEQEALVQQLQRNGTSSVGSRSSQHGHQLQWSESDSTSEVYTNLKTNTEISITEIYPSSNTDSDRTVSEELASDNSADNTLAHGAKQETSLPTTHQMPVIFKKCVFYKRRQVLLRKKRAIILAVLFLNELKKRKLEKGQLSENSMTTANDSRSSVSSAMEKYQPLPRRLPVPELAAERANNYVTTDLLMYPFGVRDHSSTRGDRGAETYCQNTFDSRLSDRNQLPLPLPLPYSLTGDETTAAEMWCETVTHGELLQKLPELVSTTLKYRSLLQESRMSTFLLQVAQAVFEEMVSLDQLIKKILEVAQHLVSADRASLFLVDHRNLELVSTVFDLRYESNNDSDFSKKEIRMPINKGIAGHVAMSGETLNIPDAYSDERFNKAVDEATGYRTVSILCMPIKVRGKVIAVVQMVNKRDKKAFETDDETAFQVFSTFFGLALHHARLYDKIKRKEQKYKVALEVLGYHNKCAEEDVINLLEEKNKDETINYNDFALNPFEVNDIEKCKGILSMFDDLFDITKFDVTVLARFVLTVKKNYRKVPYHNFDHGWAVANAMYVMLKHDTENKFDYNNRLALFVACLCHDLDHRGYTNKFMSEIASPLAAVYTTSTLEHHHFNMTVTILQQDGHNIFYHISSEEYKGILDSIRQCILATDLAAFFPNLKKINELVFETPQFDWSNVTHSALGRSFSMTCADLCAAAKPFKVQLETVQIISAEFYQQGDLERQAGRIPIPMMDRSRPEELPASQVGFLSQICLPCYEVLYELFPATKPMLTMAKANLESWKARASAIEEKDNLVLSSNQDC